MSLTRNQAIFLTVLFLLFLTNLVFLDWENFSRRRSELLSQQSLVKETRRLETPKPAGTDDRPGGCPASCLQTVFEATQAALRQIPSPAAQVTKAVPIQQGVYKGPKEFFVSLGSGSTQAGDWEDLDGVEAYLDSSKYGKIKETVFEATVNIPNGNQRAYVRLFNVTDKHPIWFSEVWLEGGTTKLLISQPITLGKGKKLYRVQMKTSLKDLAKLIQARIKIIVK